MSKSIYDEDAGGADHLGRYVRDREVRNAMRPKFWKVQIRDNSSHGVQPRNLLVKLALLEL